MHEVSTESLVERFYQSLYQFALSLARSEVVAADLTQETFYLWSAKGHQLRDASKVKAWLFTTLHREFLRRHRHSVRFPHHETSAVEHELPVVASTVETQLDAATVMQALQLVDETYRVPLAMFYLEDFSYNEIAEALEVPAGTVMSL
jgi:RNA polymerase sigma-70 factor (ECF subfamily)